MSNEKFVEYIRQCGKSIMDNAEKIANSFDYQTELDVAFHIGPDWNELPEIVVESRFIPKGIMEGDSVLIVKRDSE